MNDYKQIKEYYKTIEGKEVFYKHLESKSTESLLDVARRLLNIKQVDEDTRLLYNEIKSLSSYQLINKINFILQSDRREGERLFLLQRFDEGYNYKSRLTEMFIDIFINYGKISDKQYGSTNVKGKFYIFNGIAMIELIDNDNNKYYEFKTI